MSCSNILKTHLFVGRTTLRVYRLFLRNHHDSHTTRPLIISSCRRYLSSQSTNTETQTSSLYVKHGDDSNVAVVDVDLNLEERLGKPEDLLKNVKLRNLEDEIDLTRIVSVYREYSESKKKEESLVQEKRRVANEMKHLVTGKNNEEGQKASKESLIAEGKAIRERLKKIQAQLWDLEAEVMFDALKLPAEIHPTTEQEDRMIDFHGPKPESEGKEEGPFDQGEHIKFRPSSRGCCYLHGPLAKLELDLTSRMSENLRQAGLVQFSCPDMVKTIIMEGCGEDFTDPQQALQLQAKVSDIQAYAERGGDVSHMQKWDVMLYLTGGASLPAFASYLCKSNISQKSLPLKWFSVGRHFKPGKLGSQTEVKSLLDLSQASQVSVFGASAELCQAESLYDDYVSLIWTLYKQFSIPLRLVSVGACRLKLAEGARTDIEAWFPSRDSYIKVASVGHYGQYISRRLMSKSSHDLEDIYNKNYVYMVYGSALDTPQLMQALMEHGSLQI